MPAFATVTSIFACPVPSREIELAEMRRYVSSRREQHSENASIAREWADRATVPEGWSR